MEAQRRPGVQNLLWQADWLAASGCATRCAVERGRSCRFVIGRSSQRVLKTTPVAWAADGRPTLKVRIKPRSPVPVASDEDLYEALLFEPLLSHEDVCGDSPPSSPQPAASTQLEPMPPCAPEEISGWTPLERKIISSQAC